MDDVRKPPGITLPAAGRIVRFGAGRSSKFGNVKTTKDGIAFDSKKEAKRYADLKVLERAGRIKNLRLQVTYRCEVAGILICKYIADFVYLELEHGDVWKEVTEDCKGWPNDRWPMKKKLMAACHGIKIRET